MELFTKSNRRGLIYLLPLLAIVALLATLAEPGHKSSSDNSSTDKNKSLQTADADSIKVADTVRVESVATFTFDPNTATFEEFVALGLTKSTAASIIKYRRRGKVFSIPEEFAACYGINDSTYQALKPYISIAPEFEPKPFEYKTGTQSHRKSHNYTKRDTLIHYKPFRIDTVTVAFLRTIGFSHRRATAFIRYRDMRGGLRNIEEVRECYVIPSVECDTLARYIIFPESQTRTTSDSKIELNRADSASLRSIYGIGEKSVVEIMEYRRKLGGFVRVEQLAEVKSVTESNFEKILQQIYCDSCNISKIDVNFARSQRLVVHPYISDRALRKLLKTRQLKGGWSTIEEMIDDKIFTHDEAERLRPYLRFTRNRE